LRAIRLRCLDCSGGSAPEVAKCKFGPDHATSPCGLHEYRSGHNPKRAWSGEVRAKMAELGRRLAAKQHSLPSSNASNSDPEPNA
jgi:hypothetical protein